MSVRFPGIRSGTYARVLDVRGDVDLKTMMDLNRIAKLRYVPERRLKALARRNLVEFMDGVPCIACEAGQKVLGEIRPEAGIRWMSIRRYRGCSVRDEWGLDTPPFVVPWNPSLIEAIGSVPI